MFPKRHSRPFLLRRQEYTYARVCLHLYIFVYDRHIHIGKDYFGKASQKTLKTLMSWDTRVLMCMCVYAFIYICTGYAHTYGKGLFPESVSEDMEDAYFFRDKNTKMHVCVCMCIYLYMMGTYIWERNPFEKRLRRYWWHSFRQRQEYTYACACMHLYIFVYYLHIHMEKGYFWKASQKTLKTLVSPETRIHAYVRYTSVWEKTRARDR